MVLSVLQNEEPLHRFSFSSGKFHIELVFAFLLFLWWNMFPLCVFVSFRLYALSSKSMKKKKMEKIHCVGRMLPISTVALELLLSFISAFFLYFVSFRFIYGQNHVSWFWFFEEIGCKQNIVFIYESQLKQKVHVCKVFITKRVRMPLIWFYLSFLFDQQKQLYTFDESANISVAHFHSFSRTSCCRLFFSQPLASLSLFLFLSLLLVHLNAFTYTPAFLRVYGFLFSNSVSQTQVIFHVVPVLFCFRLCRHASDFNSRSSVCSLFGIHKFYSHSKHGFRCFCRVFRCWFFCLSLCFTGNPNMWLWLSDLFWNVFPSLCYLYNYNHGRFNSVRIIFYYIIYSMKFFFLTRFHSFILFCAHKYISMSVYLK